MNIVHEVGIKLNDEDDDDVSGLTSFSDGLKQPLLISTVLDLAGPIVL
jgi:hypothetical protein